MLGYCPHRASNTAVLAGITIRQQLDEAGEVFLDEPPEAQP
jgi:hypothetical protein